MTSLFLKWRKTWLPATVCLLPWATFAALYKSYCVAAALFAQYRMVHFQIKISYLPYHALDIIKRKNRRVSKLQHKMSSRACLLLENKQVTSRKISWYKQYIFSGPSNYSAPYGRLTQRNKKAFFANHKLFLELGIPLQKLITLACMFCWQPV